MHKANWENLREELVNYPIPNLHNKTILDTDDEINKLEDVIKQSTENNIPKTKFRVLPDVKMTEEMRRLQARCNCL